MDSAHLVSALASGAAAAVAVCALCLLALRHPLRTHGHHLLVDEAGLVDVSVKDGARPEAGEARGLVDDGARTEAGEARAPRFFDVLEQRRNFQRATPPKPWRPRLILHLDINETLILSDPAGGDSYVDSLNKIVAKLALVTPATSAVLDGTAWRDDANESDETVLSRWTWLDGTPLNPALRDPALPPSPLAHSTWDVPQGAFILYKVPALKRRFAKSFCLAAGSPGLVYAAHEYAEADAALRWPAGAPTDSPLCMFDDDGTPRHFIIPAVLEAISELARRGSVAFNPSLP
ncbi:hypothetical protein T492DRAFT_841155 [Pavlovales sp. CCMP2436]|nr:hypothetical protein T492DRAFT_841155 [Pavlovales sp. CCMP2436]